MAGYKCAQCSNEYPMWERACSRKRWIIQPVRCLTRRLREQAPSHTDSACIRAVRPAKFRRNTP
ncbi:hypothetical protein E3Z29_03285 [Pseudomonas sp. S150]|nr:hypothetical protein E3Z29_03285 [Pseudomonas sp. S150]